MWVEKASSRTVAEVADATSNRIHVETSRTVGLVQYAPRVAYVRTELGYAVAGG
jgi:hypothetical protein